MTPLPAVPGVIELGFSSELPLGSLVVPLQALGLTVVIAIALLVLARRVRARAPATRTEDIAFVVLAAIPGAVVGGRLVHGLAFWDAYVLDPGTLLDLGRGSLSLAGAVAGGALTTAYVCRQLGGRVGVWADAAAVPVLLVIGGGKIAMLLGGAGQGLPWAGRGGVALLGAGPWASTDAAVPAYPTQVLEGIWALLGIPVVLVAERRLRRRGRTGQGAALLLAVGWWLVGRAAVAVWWRDPPRLGPWGAEGIIAIALAAAVLAVALFRTMRATSSDQGPWSETARSS